MSPAGRPPMDEEERRGEMLRIRVTTEERAKLDSAAAAAGQPTGTWLRETGLVAADAQQAAAKPAPKKAAKKKA